jgi:hypothetical protein
LVREEKGQQSMQRMVVGEALIDLNLWRLLETFKRL